MVTEKEYQQMFKEFNGMTFTPRANLFEEEVEINEVKEKVFKYEIIRTADEVYQEYLNPPTPQPTTEESLSKEVASIKINNMKKDVIITNALQTIANLKVEIMELKGGNK